MHQPIAVQRVFKARRRHCFTLVEMMIVVVIIGLLAGLVGPRLLGRLDKAKRETARSQVHLLSNAVKDYYMDMDEYPKSLDDLLRNPGRNQNKWDGPYLDPAVVPKDPWGETYRYETSRDGGFTIASSGKDRSFGSADDITSDARSR
jgi:general secretion pathway protein G